VDLLHQVFDAVAGELSNLINFLIEVRLISFSFSFSFFSFTFNFFGFLFFYAKK